MKKFFLGSIALLAVSVTLSAVPLCTTNESVGSMKAYNATGGCQNGDKIYSNFEALTAPPVFDPGTSMIPDLWQVNFTEPIPDVHVVAFTQCNACGALTNIGATTTDHWGIQYRISVDPALPFKRITNVGGAVIITLFPGSALVEDQKYFYDLLGNQLTFPFPMMTTGVFDSQDIKGQTAIQVKEYITINNAQVTSFTDRFLESTVPEPATYAMMGLGLAALGLIARRKKA